MSIGTIIIALILVIIAGAVFYGVWTLIGRIPGAAGAPHAIAGIVLLLLFLAVCYWAFTGGMKTLISHRGAYEPDRIHQRALPWKASFRLTPVTLRA